MTSPPFQPEAGPPMAEANSRAKVVFPTAVGPTRTIIFGILIVVAGYGFWWQWSRLDKSVKIVYTNVLIIKQYFMPETFPVAPPDLEHNPAAVFSVRAEMSELMESAPLERVKEAIDKMARRAEELVEDIKTVNSVLSEATEPDRELTELGRKMRAEMTILNESIGAFSAMLHDRMHRESQKIN